MDLYGSGGSGGSHRGSGSKGDAGGSNSGGGSSGTDSPAKNDPLIIHRDEWGVIEPVSIVDIRSFHASAGTAHGEPNGWTIVGLDTNFYSVVATQVVRGTLLDRSASVRFVPISWHWSYGDGTVVTRGVRGTTWERQGLSAFDRTPTSHIFAKRGTYTIQLGVEFRAEYTFAGGDWTHVAGTLTLSANPLRVTASGAKTVLVSDDCRQNPRGPGC